MCSNYLFYPFIMCMSISIYIYIYIYINKCIYIYTSRQICVWLVACSHSSKLHLQVEMSLCETATVFLQRLQRATTSRASRWWKNERVWCSAVRQRSKCGMAVGNPLASKCVGAWRLKDGKTNNPIQKTIMVHWSWELYYWVIGDM